MDSEISIWLLCGSGSPEGRLGQTPGKRTEPRERPAAPSLSPVLQAGPDFISRCGPRIASAAASLPATAFVTCPAVQAPTSWTVPHGGLWAAGGSSWHAPSWVVGLSCCMGTPSTVGPTAIACIQPLVAPCTWTWACCCATLTAMAWNAEAPASSAQPHPWAPVRGRMVQSSETWALEPALPDPAEAWGSFCLASPQAQYLSLRTPFSHL